MTFASVIVLVIGILVLAGLLWFAFGTRDTSGRRPVRRAGRYGAAGAGATYFGGDGGPGGGHDGGPSCGGGSCGGGSGCGGGGGS